MYHIHQQHITNLTYDISESPSLNPISLLQTISCHRSNYKRKHAQAQLVLAISSKINHAFGI